MKKHAFDVLDTVWNGMKTGIAVVLYRPRCWMGVHRADNFSAFVVREGAYLGYSTCSICGVVYAKVILSAEAD